LRKSLPHRALADPLTSPAAAFVSVPPALPDDAPWGVYAEGVRIIALRALGDAALADDVAQEAVTRAIAAVAEGRDVDDLGAFVYGIARHLIADAHRGRARTVPLGAVPEPPAPQTDALDAAIAAEDAGRVRAAIAQLPEGERELLYLYFVEGLHADDIARRLRESPVTIRKRKSRALERLRQVFAGHDSRRPTTEQP
jgi:RNA polymerase sigma factor (sigma-70 family)